MSIRYPDIPHSPTGLTVEIHTNTGTGELQRRALVAGIVDLTGVAYSRQLEASAGGPLRDGTIKQLYASEGKSREVRRTMNAIMGAYGAYYAVHSPDNPTQIDGLANLHATEPVFDHDDIYLDPDYDVFYLSNLLARQPKRGIGSAVLHAALLRKSAIDTCVLDGFGMLDEQGHDQNPINQWYERLGFVNRGRVGDLTLGDQKIPAVRYIAESIGEVRQNLETMYPALKTYVRE